MKTIAFSAALFFASLSFAQTYSLKESMNAPWQPSECSIDGILPLLPQMLYYGGLANLGIQDIWVTKTEATGVGVYGAAKENRLFHSVDVKILTLNNGFYKLTNPHGEPQQGLMVMDPEVVFTPAGNDGSEDVSCVSSFMSKGFLDNYYYVSPITLINKDNGKTVADAKMQKIARDLMKTALTFSAPSTK